MDWIRKASLEPTMQVDGKETGRVNGMYNTTIVTVNAVLPGASMAGTVLTDTKEYAVPVSHGW